MAPSRGSTTSRLKSRSPNCSASEGSDPAPISSSATRGSRLTPLVRPRSPSGSALRFRGHLGYIDVRVNGDLVGEIDVLPDKMSVPAYDILRAELERVWVGLAFAHEGLSRVSAAPPTPTELWRSIEGPTLKILAEPGPYSLGKNAPRRLRRRHRPPSQRHHAATTSIRVPGPTRKELGHRPIDVPARERPRGRCPSAAGCLCPAKRRTRRRGPHHQPPSP